jgi:hypothetical protein
MVAALEIEPAELLKIAAEKGKAGPLTWKFGRVWSHAHTISVGDHGDRTTSDRRTATALLRYGLAAARFSSFGACSGAPSHCLALPQQSAS